MTTKYRIAINANFPLEDEVLVHAQGADVMKSQEASFSSVRFFLKKFPVMLLKGDNESFFEATDPLEQEFTSFT